MTLNAGNFVNLNGAGAGSQILIGTDNASDLFEIDDDASVNVADADVIHGFTAGSGSNGDRIQIGDGTGGQSVILRQEAGNVVIYHDSNGDGTVDSDEGALAVLKNYDLSAEGNAIAGFRFDVANGSDSVTVTSNIHGGSSGESGQGNVWQRRGTRTLRNP